MKIYAVVALAVLLSCQAKADEGKVAARQWKAKCSSCHGLDGRAQTASGQKMKIIDFTSADFKKKPDAELRSAIVDGVDKGDKLMDPFKDELTPEQIEGLIKLIKAL